MEIERQISCIACDENWVKVYGILPPHPIVVCDVCMILPREELVKCSTCSRTMEITLEQAPPKPKTCGVCEEKQENNAEVETEKQTIRLRLYPVVRKEWVVSERSWGDRSDGYSLHINTKDMHDYINDYWEKMSDGPASSTYAKPISSETIVDVDYVTYQRIQKSLCGIRMR